MTHPNAPDSDFPGDKKPARGGRNVPAKQDAAPQDAPAPEQKQLSTAEKQRKRMEALLTAVEARSEQFVTLLEDSGITFRRFLEVFRRALIQNPDLLLADAGSVIQACMNACTDGLLPDGRQGAIVVYNTNIGGKGQPKQYAKKAQWQPMYQGLLQVAYASGNFKAIQARVVYEGDVFSYTLGIRPKVKHIPARRPSGTTPAIVAAYASAITVNGGEFFEPFEGDDIRKVNAVSRATSGPGKDWPEEMARKGPLRRMWKYLPKNGAMERIIEHDDENFDQDLLAEAEDEAAAPARRLSGGFGKQAALQQSAQPTMPDMEIHGEQGDDKVDRGDPAREEQTQRRQADAPAQDAAAGADQGGEGQTAGDTGDDGAASPALLAFRKALDVATSWLNVKQGLRTLAKEEGGTAPEDFLEAWERVESLREGGAQIPDFVSDDVLFECWLEGTQPDGDAIDGNWAILQKSKDFLKLSPERRDEVAMHVAAAKDGGG